MDASMVAPVDTGASAEASTGPRVELGTGLNEFEAISTSEAPELELVYGPQGGWHVDVTVRLYDLNVDRLVLVYRAFPAGSTNMISLPIEIILAERRLTPEGDHFLRLGDGVRFDIQDPSEVVGEQVDLVVTATEEDGVVSVSDQRRITVVDEN